MRVYAPQISVKLVKAIKRTEVVPGAAVADRYKRLEAIDLTDFLGESGQVQVVKGIREPAGGFNITFRDALGSTDNKTVVDTIAALVEPMDLIEIRMCRDPTLYAAGDWPPVVMRGFVSEVTRNENISSDQQPTRTVTIAGQDFGKILQILQIYYLNNSVIDQYVLTEFAYFQKYAEAGDAKIKLANDVLNDVVTKVINPFLQTLTALANGESVGAKVVNSWTVEANVEGAVHPWAIASMSDCSVYQMLCTIFDVGPFNELFVEDTKDGVKIVLRPNPFLDASGNPIQGVKAETVSITDQDVLGMAMSRSDSGVANYYWAINSKLAFMGNEDAQLAAMTGDQSNFILKDYFNANAEHYGFRKMQVETLLLDPAFTGVDTQKKPDTDNNTKAITSWLDKRRKTLSDTNKDNVVFEEGTIQVKGNEQLKAGRQLIMTRAEAVPVTGYITRVEHTFQPLYGFTSTLTVERMTTFIERAKAQTSQYRPEMRMGVS